MAKKVAFLTLGCKTNQYETNGMMQQFLDAGYEICNADEEPDIYIVNTCTVTNIADRKSRQSLRKVKNKKDTIVIAVGCYAQVAKDTLQNMPEIDIILGNKEKKNIIKYIEDYEISKNKIVDVANINMQQDFDEYGCITYTEKARTTIKIQDGCLEEARKIANEGIKEIVLTGIHIASYGKDFNEEYELVDLLEDLNKIEGIERIRLGSLEPTIIIFIYLYKVDVMKL